MSPRFGVETGGGGGIIVARKSSSAPAGNPPASTRLAGLGYPVTTNLSAVVADCAAYDLVVIDCDAWAADEHSTFIQQLIAAGQRVLVCGNDTRSIFFATANHSTSIHTPNQVGAAQPIGGQIHPVWQGVTSYPTDTDAGFHITALAPGAVAYGVFANDTAAYSVIEWYDDAEDGKMLFVPRLGITGASADLFITNAIEYLWRRTGVVVGTDTAEFVHLLEIEFSGGNLYLSTGAQNLNWGDQTWEAVGGLLGFGGVQEIFDGKAQGVDIQLSGIDQSLVATLLTNQYRGRRIRIYRAYLNQATGRVIADPILLCEGLQLSAYTVEEAREDRLIGTVTISTRVSSYLGVTRIRGIQTSVIGHQHYYPGDTFFQYVPELATKKVYWGTAAPSGVSSSGWGGGSPRSWPGQNQ